MKGNQNGSEPDWYDLLKSAIVEPEGKSMKDVIERVRREGVFALQSTELHSACHLLQNKADHSKGGLDAVGLAPALPPVAWLLRRLGNAGVPPTYSDYTGLDALTYALSPIYESPLGASLTSSTWRLLFEMFTHLSELPQLQDHPKREVLEAKIEALRAVCRDHLFANQPHSLMSGYLVNLSLLPETNIPDELFFLRTVQGTESVFSTGERLAGLALERLAFGEVLPSALILKSLGGLLALLLPLARLLAPMSVETWQKIRPLIFQPSAIQSPSFHQLWARLIELGRILNHPRVSSEERVYMDIIANLLRDARGKLGTWYAGHAQIAAKYAGAMRGPDSEGVAWLRQQQSQMQADADRAEWHPAMIVNEEGGRSESGMASFEGVVAMLTDDSATVQRPA